MTTDDGNPASRRIRPPRLPVRVRPWRLAVRVRPWRQWSVRSRMVLSVAALAAVALVVTNLTAGALLRSYLMKRVDAQLTSQSRGFVRPDGRSMPESTYRPYRPPAFGPDSRMYRYDDQGVLNAEHSDTRGDGPDLSDIGDISERSKSRKPFTVDGESSPWRVLVTQLPYRGGYAVSAVSLREVQETEEWFLLIDVVISVLVLLLMGMAAASVVRIGLRPLTRMQHTAAAIADGDLSQRIADANPHTEAGQLGTALNTMLGRIEAAVDEQAASERRLRQLLADAAHELRTPLTSIQGFAELYRRGGAPPGPDLDEAMARVHGEASRMRILVNDLLLLARLDEAPTLERRPVDLLAVAADAIRDAHVRAPARFVELAALSAQHETIEPVMVLADEPRIRQVVTNLVANALQHTPPQAHIAVRVGRPEDAVELDPPVATIGAVPPPGQPLGAVEVADTGPGMTEDVAARVFERLYRGDPSRSRRHGGTGLGLAIVASIVRAHGGRIELRTSPGAGARFRVLLAARPAPDDE